MPITSRARRSCSTRRAWDAAPIPYFERAVTLDPGYVRAYQQLVVAHSGVLSVSTGLTQAEVDQHLARMNEYSSRALAAAPDLWVGHIARAIYFLAANQIPNADRELARAEKLDRGDDPELKFALANMNLLLGRMTKGEAQYQASVLMDPVRRFEGWSIEYKYYLGRFDEAIDEYKRLREAGVALTPQIHVEILSIYMGRREYDKAREAAEASGMLNVPPEVFSGSAPPNPLWLATTAERKAAMDGIAGKGGSFLVAGNALPAAASGYPAAALDFLRFGLERPGLGKERNLWDPNLAEGRKTAAFEKLVTDLGFVAAWRASGDWGDYCKPRGAREITCH